MLFQVDMRVFMHWPPQIALRIYMRMYANIYYTISDCVILTFVAQESYVIMCADNFHFSH